MMGDVEHILDDDAGELYKLLQGIDTEYSQNLLAKSIDAEKKREDNARTILIELAHLISAYLLEVNVQRAPVAGTETFSGIVDAFDNLQEVSRGIAPILIRYRGIPNAPDVGETDDYEIVCGNTTVDAAAVADLVQLGVRMAPELDQLKRAFRVFYELDIYSIYLRYNSSHPKDITRFNDALQALSLFQSAVERRVPIEFENAWGTRINYPLIANRDGIPDVNLTLLGIANRINPASLNGLVRKIAATRLADQYMSVYNAIFAVKKLKGRLKRPPMEINNVLWLMADREKEALSEEKAQVAQFAIKHAGGSPLKAAKILKSVYGNDYETIQATELGERLQVSSDLLSSVEQEARSEQMQQEIIGNIERRLDTVGDQVIDDLFSEARTGSDRQSSVLGSMHGTLRDVTTFYKQRLDTKRKMRHIISKAAKFNLQDYETLAKDFEISTEDAKALIKMLEGCFDDKGHFIRGAFARILPEVARYERKMFEFLWHYLREYVHRKDRMAFLNSLQILIARMQKPKIAVKILLADLYREPENISYSDPKGLMLCSLLIRKYNKELIDLEITPEDILKVDEGLDEAVTDYTAWRIHKDQERFFEKIKTIHQALIESLDAAATDNLPLSPDFLLKLEREVYIFLALVGGVTARSVVISAMNDYANPGSRLYAGNRSADFVNGLFQNLRIVVRGLARLGRPEDLHYLNALEQQGAALALVGASEEYEKMIAKILRIADVTKTTLAARSE